MIIAIDFDGTIVEDAYPEIGKIKENAKRVINRLHAEGHYIIIWTCRNGSLLYKAVQFLHQNDVKFHAANESNADNVAKYGSDTRKVSADIYIDDKIIGGFPGWDNIDNHFFYVKK